jgi:hypothetical protein
MSNHFIAINRGQEGMLQSDWVTGTSSTAASDIELRIADGANLTRKDVVIALQAMVREFLSPIPVGGTPTFTNPTQ